MPSYKASYIGTHLITDWRRWSTVLLLGVVCVYGSSQKAKQQAKGTKVSGTRVATDFPGVKVGMRVEDFEKVIAANGIRPIGGTTHSFLTLYSSKFSPTKVIRVWLSPGDGDTSIVRSWKVVDRRKRDWFVDYDGPTGTFPSMANTLKSL